jgi:hypothetical protein
MTKLFLPKLLGIGAFSGPMRRRRKFTTSIFSHGSDTSPTNTLSERMADLGGNFTGTSRLLATSEKAFC